ncbi:MAG: retroviral-like aspartic protease family protein [Methylomonas sp.]|jgi:aspartyl protease family protein|uniref:retropepsin-like aspartic protease family protein n=1 Tax=Methylomonas sp. TaxID=418 RepID=UPI0025F6DCA8|nr:retropepsin-like aspartic protease [Methylomonas sp.]MCK9606381.1 retroviral-like aspartic protease family protein [Methylomonas sp.]
MGIQDRDYYWERHKEAAKSNNGDFDGLLNRKPSRYQKPAKKSSGNLRYLLTPALMLFGLWHGADRLLKFKATQQPALPTIAIPAVPETIQAISGGIEIKADRQGHFRGTVIINNVPMPFLIDTGATITSIPANLAYAARLPIGAQINSNTAGGKVIDRLTQINSLKIGNAEIRNLDAAINQHLDEVLIGMNTLKYFNMSQSGNTLTLVANGSTPQQIVPAPTPSRANTMTAEQPLIQPTLKRPTTIKKTVTCDAKQVCTTKYSDR